MTIATSADAHRYLDRKVLTLRLALAGVLALLVYSAIASALTLRPLYADGGVYLFNMLRVDGFYIVEPSRRLVQFLVQLPLVGALRLGVTDVDALAVTFAASLQLMPIVLTIACYFILPEGKKAFFVFPLLHVLAGLLSTSVAPIGEASVATAYFWVLFTLLLFRADQPRRIGLIFLLALPFVFAHEAMVFVIPFLIIAAAWRLSATSSWMSRLLLMAVLAVLAAALIAQIGFIVEPRSTTNRGSFIRGILALYWLRADDSWNLPAVLGLAALGALFLINARVFAASLQKWFGRRAVDVAFGVCWAVLALLTIGVVGHGIWEMIHGDIDPYAQFAARDHPALISAPLAAAALIYLRWPSLTRTWAHRGNLVVIGALTVGTVAWHAAATAAWSHYVSDFREMLAANSGFLTWEEARVTLPDETRLRFNDWTWDWTTSMMSVVLAPDAKVETIIGNRNGRVHRFFNPLALDEVAQLTFFDTTAYRAAVAGATMGGSGEPNASSGQDP